MHKSTSGFMHYTNVVTVSLLYIPSRRRRVRVESSVVSSS
eukprot:06927.XXX_310174_310293_1 [CDS] Oithona nana genome sequencing.